jgi:outer membrane murein-binding lipoprotein Lpp
MTLFAVAVPVALTAGTVGSLTTFVNGTVTDANEINANFEAIRVAVDDNAAQIAALSGGAAGGVTFVRWGRQDCPTGTDLVYSGFVGGKSHTHGGSGTNTLCLASNPEYDQYNDADHNGALIYGVEMEMSSYGLNGAAPFNSLHDATPGCAVCRDSSASTQFMYPGTQTCPTGWNKRVRGYLMANHYTQASSTFVCVDENVQAGPHNPADSQNGTLWYPTEGECGSLPCGPGQYVQNREITCSICTL